VADLDAELICCTKERPLKGNFFIKGNFATGSEEFA
jgi:hypothetical protein